MSESKSVTYLFPSVEKAAYMKVFQEKTSQITAFYFTKDNIEDVQKIKNSSNYALYFLFDNSESDQTKVYVGQSVNGINRIKEHSKSKSFWSYAIMFVTDNNSFDRLIIDYLEYYFIGKVSTSPEFTLENNDLRTKEPNCSVYDRPNLDTFIRQIEFLLMCEGVDISIKHTDKRNIKYYEPAKGYDAKLFVDDGKFILVKGSELRRPPESSKQWKDKLHFSRYNNIIDDFLSNGKVKEINGKLIAQVNLTFRAPSPAADLISGMSENGWFFFKGLNKLRERRE